jgi:hypothetical protein
VKKEIKKEEPALERVHAVVKGNEACQRFLKINPYYNTTWNLKGEEPEPKKATAERKEEIQTHLRI